MPLPGPKANPHKGTIKVEPKHNPRFFRSLGIKLNPANSGHAAAMAKGKSNAKTTATSSSQAASETAGADAALAALQSSLAEVNAKKQGNT
jgi:RNA polymerase II elongation factor ELL